MSKGNATASATRATAGRRGSDTSGDDSSTTGSNVIMEIAHSDSISTVNSSAIRMANANGAAKATTSIRRSGSIGRKVSTMAATLGRAASKAKITGAAI